MDLRKEMKEWFDTHRPQANDGLFRRLEKDPVKWEIIKSETNFLNEKCSRSERIWHYYHRIYEIPKCVVCGNLLKFRLYSNGYPETCSKSCTTKKKWTDGKMNDCLEQRVETFKAVWGKDGARHQELLDKREQTSMTNYGATHHMKSKEYYESYKQKEIERSGYDNVAKRPEVKQKIKDNWDKKENKDEINQKKHINSVKSLQEKYGVDNIFSEPKTRERIEQLNLIKYGVRKPFQSQEFQDYMKTKMVEKYGYENPSQVPELKLKKRNHMESTGSWVPVESLSEWILYKRAVGSVTSKSLKDFGDLKFGTGWRETLGLMGVDNGMQVDHVYSIKDGFTNNILPYIIGNINNLRIISWEENLSKSSKSEISIEELYQTIFI